MDLVDKSTLPAPAPEKKARLKGFAPLFLFLATVLILVLFTYPKIKEIKTRRDDLEKLKIKSGLLDAKLKVLGDLNDFKDVLEADLKLVNGALPSDAEVPLLLTEVQTIATESGLEISNLSYSSSLRNPKAQTDVVNVQLTAGGSFTEIRTFLTSVEIAARIIDISTLRFSSVKGAESSSLNSSEVEATLGLISPFLFVESKAVTEDPITLDIKNPDFIAFINRLKEFRVYENIVDTSNIGKDNPFTP